MRDRQAGDLLQFCLPDAQDGEVRRMSRIKIMFGHAGVSLMALAAVVAFVAMLWGAPLWSWALVPLGVAAQMLNEYNLHRHVFHPIVCRLCVVHIAAYGGGSTIRGLVDAIA